MVLNMMGHSEAYTARVIFASGPEPITSSTSGTSAVTGIGRRNSTIAAVAVRSTGTLPSSSPAGTPTAIAMRMAISQASMVATTSRRKSASPSRSPTVTRTTLGGGMKSLLTRPTWTTTSQSRRKPTRPARPRSSFFTSAGRLRRDHRGGVDLAGDDTHLQQQVGHPLEAPGVQGGAVTRQGEQLGRVLVDLRVLHQQRLDLRAVVDRVEGGLLHRALEGREGLRVRLDPLRRRAVAGQREVLAGAGVDVDDRRRADELRRLREHRLRHVGRVHLVVLQRCRHVGELD